MDTGLEGQQILVTGASGGIGGAMARLLAAEGAIPILHAHENRAAVEALAEELRRGGIEAPVVVADLRDGGAVAAMWTRLRGPVAGVIANAGVWPATPQRLHELSEERWRDTLAVNLDGVFRVVRAFFRHLAEVPRSDASVVLVSSTAGLFGEAGHADDAAAKAALTYGLLPSLKNEIVSLAPRGRVNCVAPGWTATPMAAGALDDPEVTGRALATTPLQKVATPEDVARSAVFLSSPTLAGHLTGVVLPVHGGMEGRVLAK